MSVIDGHFHPLFIVKEPTEGTAVWPAAADTYLPYSADFKQELAFHPDNQKRDTLGEVQRTKGIYKPGEFTINGPILPSGALGTAPKGGALIEAHMGIETVTGSTDVTYTQKARTADKISVSILEVLGHEVYLHFGCLVAGQSLPIKAGEGEDSIFQATWTGQYRQSYRAGTSLTTGAVDGTSTPVTVIPVTAGTGLKRFDIGSKVIIGTDTNSSAGFTVAAGTDADNLTISPALETSQASGVTVSGWYPTVTEAGTLVDGNYGTMTTQIGAEGYIQLNCIDATVESNNGYHIINNVKNGSAYPSESGQGRRTVTMAVSELMKKNGSNYKYESEQQTARDVKLSAGATAAYRGRVEIANWEMNQPTRSGDDEITIAVDGPCHETATRNDAYSIIFD